MLESGCATGVRNVTAAVLSEGKFAELRVRGSRIKAHYHETGDGEDHVIFLQTGGAATSAFLCWYMNMEEFARAGYKVYAPDAVGFGSTEITSGEGIGAAEFATAFMDEMGISRAHLVGNSMGSMTATRFALDYPERTKSLILTGGEPRLDTEESRALARELGKTARMDFVRAMLSQTEVSFSDMRRATADFFYDPHHPLIDEVAKMRLDILRRPGVRKKEREGAMRQVERGRSNFSSSDLAKITAPTYLIHGRDERHFYPKEIAPILLECAMKVAFTLPDGSITLLSHCGHWPQLERAETFNKLSIEFLSQIGKNGER
jgi:2-hydroxy-6-oxonona-2,4-dienedioate hydrolase